MNNDGRALSAWSTAARPRAIGPNGFAYRNGRLHLIRGVGPSPPPPASTTARQGGRRHAEKPRRKRPPRPNLKTSRKKRPRPKSPRTDAAWVAPIRGPRSLNPIALASWPPGTSLPNTRPGSKPKNPGLTHRHPGNQTGLDTRLSVQSSGSASHMSEKSSILGKDDSRSWTRPRLAG